jgi:hypothetical protein
MDSMATNRNNPICFPNAQGAKVSTALEAYPYDNAVNFTKVYVPLNK